MEIKEENPLKWPDTQARTRHQDRKTQASWNGRDAYRFRNSRRATEMSPLPESRKAIAALRMIYDRARGELEEEALTPKQMREAIMAIRETAAKALKAGL